MNDDTRFVLRSVGCIPAVLGGLTIALGAALAATGWRYMGLALIFALIWGGAASGIGLVTLATGRRWIALAGAFVCTLSAAVTALYNLSPQTPAASMPLEPWQFQALAIDAVGILAGVVQAVFRRRTVARH
jgi:hypothetical protein